MSEAKKTKVKNGIVQRGKKWAYVLRIPDPLTGKTKPVWVSGFDSEKSAKVARDKARVALSNRDYVAPTKTTVGDFLTTWIELHARHIRPTTLNGYRKIIKNYLIPGLGVIKLQDIRPTHIEAFYSDLLIKPGVSGKNLSPTTVVRCGALLKKAFKYAVEVEGLLSFNPVSRVAMPKTRPSTPTPWTMSELNVFLKACTEHRLGFFFRLSAFTGARRGELLALRWSDFDGKTITISKSRTDINGAVIEQNTTKGGNNGQRRVSLDTDTIELLKAHADRQADDIKKAGNYWEETGYIFVQESGLPLYPTTVTSLFNKIAKGAGLRPIRLHDLRHIHATELLRLGEPLHVVAERLGHRDAMVTATIYAHVSNEQGETASSRFANAVREAS
jgi:integrase